MQQLSIASTEAIVGQQPRPYDIATDMVFQGGL